MSTNNKISNLVSSQAPFFVRNDHETFVRFIEAYYEYLEQDEKVVDRIKNVQTFQNIDLIVDEFADQLYNSLLKFLPEETLADRKMILKNAKDFYRARGTEKATRFLMRILFEEEIDIYYPKKDILRVSDGKWYVQQSLRIEGTKVDGVANSSLSGLEKYIATTITGANTRSTAIVERVDRYYDQGTLIDEIVLSNINGDFVNGEQIISLFDGPEATQNITSNIFGGVINTITVDNPGSSYEVGDPVVVLSNDGSGACAIVSLVSTGNIATITVINGGAGFTNGNYLLFTGGGSGSGANANVISVTDDSSIHPNTYNITNTTILVEANTQIGNAVYTNLQTTNAYSWIANGLNFWQFANTGPARQILVINTGVNYSENPTISIIANTSITALGILGRMEIINGGTQYRVGDIIQFTNVVGGYGAGANAMVTAVNVSNSNTITQVKFQSMAGHIVGGSGYDQNFLPTANVLTTTGANANVIVTTTLGSGASFISANSTIGAIQRITILSRGSGYDEVPTIDLTDSGDGLATADATIIEGLYTYPGRYLNDDGFLSSYNFIQDRDYYQNFSYVIKVKQSINKYRQAMKELLHPAGTKMFGEYVFIGEIESTSTSNASNDATTTFTKKTYVKLANTVNISYTSHGFANGTTIYLEYQSGNFSNVQNGIYITSNSALPNNIFVQQRLYAGNTSGNVYVGRVVS